MKHSYMSPLICTEKYHSNMGVLPQEAPVSPPTSWDETLQRLDACGTHSYIEETGCLQNKRSSASLHARPERPTSFSGPVVTSVKPHIHPPAPSLCLHPLTTQEKPALPLSCARVSHALGVISDLHGKTAAMGLIECSSDFEVAWISSDPAHNFKHTNPYAVSDSDLERTTGHSGPLINETWFGKKDSVYTENNYTGSDTSSSPAVLHLPLHCQTQMRGRAPWVTEGSHQGSALSGIQGNTTGTLTDTVQERSGPTREESKAMVVVRSTDRAVFSEYTDTGTSSGGPWSTSASPLCDAAAGKQGTRPGISLALSRVKNQEGVDEAWELVSPGGKEGSLWDSYAFGAPWALTQSRRGDMDAFLKAEGSEGQGEEQIIEVDGWCHLPRFHDESSKSTEKATQVFWGLPEKEVRVWGAQILLALESLHQQGILCRDLNPRNILLTNNGKVCLTFFGQWSEVQSEISSQAIEQMYCAPEIGGVSKITEGCDWWSLGALLFELLTGTPLWQLHPAGINSHTQLLIPDHLSTAAASLLTELLQFDAGYRLGSGGGGVSDIKCHPFFSGVSWKALSS